MLLSRVPMGRLGDPVPAIGAAAWAFPLVGVVVGGLSAATLGLGLALHVPAGVASGLALLAGVLATGGLHEDGLADLADGFGGGHDRARKLEIMRDSRVGSYGVLALVLALGLRWSALAGVAAVAPDRAMMALVAIGVASRAGLATVLRLMPAARADGLGRAATGASRVAASVSAAIGLVALVLFAGPIGGAALALGSMLVLAAVAGLAWRQIGGQTGDVLGAMQQGTDIAAWIMVSAWIGTR
jgi:adenosylcobinamide-GDP ribazoletransferase